MPRPLFALAPLCAGLLSLGCSSDEGQVYDAADPMNHDDEHAHVEADHADVGPHGGAIVELTADHSVHGELVLDGGAAGRGTFYLLGGDLKTPVEAEGVALFADDPDTGAETNIDLDPAADGGWSFTRGLLPGDDDDVEGRVRVRLADGGELNGAFDTGAHAGHDHDDHDHDDHGHDDHGEDDHAGHDHDEDHDDHD